MEKAIVKAAACLSIAAIIFVIKDSSAASFVSLFAFIAIGIIATRK